MNSEIPNNFKLNQFPPEILECVFHYLPRTSLIECQKVNKAWYALSSPLVWEEIIIGNQSQASSLLSNLSKEDSLRLTKYAKSLMINNRRNFIEIDIIKQLLLLFPYVEKFYMRYVRSESISKINNQEYLLKLVQGCPKITSFRLGSYSYFYNTNTPYRKDYNEILYALRHSLLKIVIESEKNSGDDWDLSEILTPFSKLEELDLLSIRGPYSIKWWLPVFKVLPRLKILHLRVYNNRDLYLIDKDIEAFIDKNMLQNRLEAVEKLIMMTHNDGGYGWFNQALIHFITQYFIGLKDISLICKLDQSNILTQELWSCQELLNFICSREKLCVYIEVNAQNSERNDILDFLNIFLHTNFNHALLDTRRKIFNDLRITLNCNNSDRENVQPNARFSIALTSRKMINHRILRTTAYRASFYKKDEYRIRKSISSILPTLSKNDTLTIKSKSEIFSFANFYLIGQALSMIPGPVKKITLEIENNTKWSQYFMKYKKIQNYHQFTHLEILVNIIDNETADQLGFSQFSIIFPNVKNLALQFYNGIWDKEKYEFLMNLPRLSLDHFTLDISLIKYKARQLMKEHNDFCGTSFTLHIETSMNEYYYQVSFEDLSIKELKAEDIKKTSKPKMIIANILLNDIKCLELYLLNGMLINYRLYDYDINNLGYDLFHKKVGESHKVWENKIKFS